MPKAAEKKRKRINTEYDSNYDNNNEKTKKRRGVSVIVNETDKISKSRQLVAKTERNSTKTSQYNGNSKKKPLPSLAELEKMFEDSTDGDNFSFTLNKFEAHMELSDNDVEENLNSYKPLKKLTQKLVKLSENSPETIEINWRSLPCSGHTNDAVNSEHNVPTGSKKNDQKTQANELDGKSNMDIVDVISDEDDIFDHKFKSTANSESILNVKANKSFPITDNTDVISPHSDASNESNKTISYDFNAISPSNRLRTFSPIPSTSTDNETFLKNDIRFNESLLLDDTQQEVEVIEIPCETIILDDENDDNPFTPIGEPCTEQIITCPPTMHEPPPDEYYSTINIDESFDDDCEIVDVDVVINENKALLEKYRQNTHSTNNTNTASIINVESNTQNVNDDTQNINDTPINSTGEKIAAVVRNFFSNPFQNSENNLSESSGMTPRTFFDCIKDFTQYLVTSYTNQASNTNTQLPTRQAPNNIVCDNIKPTGPKNINSDQSLTVGFANTPKRRRTISNKRPNLFNVQASIDLSTPNNRLIRRGDRVIIPTVHQNSSSSNHSERIPICPGDHVIIPTIYQNSSNHAERMPICPSDCVIIPTVYQKSSSLNHSKHRPRTKNICSVTNNTVCDALTPTKEIPRIGDCPICLDNLSNRPVAATKCGHVFCMKCIQTAIRASGKRCPTCRKVLKGTAYHQIFL